MQPNIDLMTIQQAPGHLERITREALRSAKAEAKEEGIVIPSIYFEAEGRMARIRWGFGPFIAESTRAFRTGTSQKLCNRIGRLFFVQAIGLRMVSEDHVLKVRGRWSRIVRSLLRKSRSPYFISISEVVVAKVGLCKSYPDLTAIMALGISPAQTVGLAAIMNRDPKLGLQFAPVEGIEADVTWKKSASWYRDLFRTVAIVRYGSTTMLL